LNRTAYSGNTCSDGSATPERFCHKEAQDKFKVSDLSTHMASEVISEHLILKKFGRGARPNLPSMRVYLRTHHHQCPPNLKYLRPPLHMVRSNHVTVS